LKLQCSFISLAFSAYSDHPQFQELRFRSSICPA
jgi:hypothetical protein